jgi:hypothetical protein
LKGRGFNRAKRINQKLNWVPRVPSIRAPGKDFHSPPNIPVIPSRDEGSAVVLAVAFINLATNQVRHRREFAIDIPGRKVFRCG